MESTSSAVVGSSPSSEPVFMDANAGIIVFGRMMVVVWRGETTRHAVEQLQRIGTDLLHRHGSAAVIGIVEETAKLPSSEARALSAQVNDDLAAKGAVAFAGVLPQQGFIAAWVRGVITGLTLLSRKRYPFGVFQTSREACEWCHSQLGSATFNVPSAVAAVEAFRADYAKSWTPGLN